MIILDTTATYIPGSYSQPVPADPAVVPSLSALCMHLLTPFPDQVHQLHPVRLQYRGIHAQIVPDPAIIDPRLWVNLVQIYNALPPSLRTLRIPLADVHLPLLQRIPQSPSFSLITVLDLSSCSLLTDASFISLKQLTTLTALDASATSVSPAAFRSLTSALLFDDPTPQAPVPPRRGPWSLRILRICNCANITDDIHLHLARFPLLSAVDLRGTSCDPKHSSVPPFVISSDDRLYHPASLTDALDALDVPSMYSSDNVFTVYIDKLQHLKPKPSHLKTSIKHSRWIGPPARRLLPLADNPPPIPATPTSTVRPDAFYASKPLVSKACARQSKDPIRHVPDEPQLMLYRTPPRWDTLPSWSKPSASAKEKQAAVRASVDRARMGAIGSVRPAKRPRIYEPGEALDLSPMPQANASEMKNPFRRNTNKDQGHMPTFGGPFLPLRRVSKPARAPVPPAAKTTSRPRPAPQNKPLMPISSIRIPILSPRTRARALAEEELVLRSMRGPTARPQKEKKVQQRLNWGAWGKANNRSQAAGPL